MVGGARAPSRLRHSARDGGTRTCRHPQHSATPMTRQGKAAVAVCRAWEPDRTPRHPPVTPPSPAARALALVVLLGAAACGEDTTPSTPTPTASPSPTPSPSAAAYTPCDAAVRVGEFAIELGEGFTALEGRVRDAVIPANVRAVTAESGRCKLLQGRSLFCDPACGASQTCGEGGVCIAFPTAKSVGAVTVSGLSTALTIMPTAVNFYSNGATTIPHPRLRARRGHRPERRGRPAAGLCAGRRGRGRAGAVDRRHRGGA
jgi:hypothetical protein